MERTSDFVEIPSSFDNSQIQVSFTNKFQQSFQTQNSTNSDCEGCGCLKKIEQLVEMSLMLNQEAKLIEFNESSTLLAVFDNFYRYKKKQKIDAAEFRLREIQNQYIGIYQQISLCTPSCKYQLKKLKQKMDNNIRLIKGIYDNYFQFYLTKLNSIVINPLIPNQHQSLELLQIFFDKIEEFRKNRSSLFTLNKTLPKLKIFKLRQQTLMCQLKVQCGMAIQLLQTLKDDIIDQSLNQLKEQLNKVQSLYQNNQNILNNLIASLSLNQ